MDPYDEFPYRSLPVEWTAPERLALTSLLHGGPRLSPGGCRVLELGCGDGANLLALAYYRRHAAFVGVDASHTAIECARRRLLDLDLDNLRFMKADFREAAERLEGEFDVIIAHGVFSWIARSVRDAFFALSAAKLRPGGLLYLNYNAKPGWNVRGMVRDFLCRETASIEGLEKRTIRAQEVAATMATSLGRAGDHPYARLMEREFQFVCQGHPSYVAHEFLASDNHAYWRREFISLADAQGFWYVADADFNHPSGRTAPGLGDGIASSGLTGQPVADIVDFVSYRQIHAPILTSASVRFRPPSPSEIAALYLASPLQLADPSKDSCRTFRHPNGFEVEVRDESLSRALQTVGSQWPCGQPVGTLLADVAAAGEDLILLYRHGLLDLRLTEPQEALHPDRLNESERRWGGYVTSPFHVVSAGGMSPDSFYRHAPQNQ